MKRRKTAKARKGLKRGPVAKKRNDVLKRLEGYLAVLGTTPKPIANPPKRMWGGVHLEELVSRAKARHRVREEAKYRAVTVDQMVKANHPASVFPGGQRPANAAMDSAINNSLAWVQAQMGSAILEGTTFLGYAYLALLTQRPEYRRISEVIATEMTRRWIKFSANGGKDKTAKIAQLEKELDRLKVRDAFRELAEQDGFFGRAHLYLDTGSTDDRNELKLPLGNGRDEISRLKVQPGAIIAPAKTPEPVAGAQDFVPPEAQKKPIAPTPVTPPAEKADADVDAVPFPEEPAPPERKPGNFRALRTIEAVWCYPTNYEASDPLKPDWYNPVSWFVQGKEVHRSRLLTFVGREVPDLLKPAYSFGGLALSQMAKPYVDNWLITRQAVTDLVKSFTVFILKTDLGESLAPQGNDLFNRVDLFNTFRTNQGTMVVDKESEDFANVTTSLSSLDALQAQAQEHMASVSGIPLVKLLGIQPAGLNASSEGEIRVFYDWVNAYQESFFRRHLTTVIDFAMLNIWGEIDEDIKFEFVHLWSLNEKEQAEMDKMRAETGVILIDGGVIEPAEERKRVATAGGSVYASIDVNAVPEPEMSDEEAMALLMGGGQEIPGQTGGEEEGDGEGAGFSRASVSSNFRKKGEEEGWKLKPPETKISPPETKVTKPKV